MNNQNLTLRELSVGEGCVVKSLNARGSIRGRLLDLGICEGAELFCIGKSPFGDPKLYLIGGRLIAIRDSTSELVNIGKG